MAEESGQKKQLRQEIAHTRDRLARDLEGLRYELDFPLKFRKSFQRHSAVWITAAALLGVVLMAAPARKKKIYVKTRGRDREQTKKGILGAGFALGVAKIAASLLRPAIMSYVTTRMGGPARKR